MNSFQCLMGGNGMQFQDSLSSSSVVSSSLVLLDNNNNTRNTTTTTSSSSSSEMMMIKKKNKKKKKKKKKQVEDRKVIKVLKPDGEINLYHKPIRVSEVMTQDFMVCRSDSFYIGQKIPPLSQHDRLQPGHTYFLLPTRLFHSVLSFVTIASFANSCQNQHDNDDSNNANVMKMKAAFLKKAAASSCSPFDIQKTSSGTLRIRVSEIFISQLMMDQHQPNKEELIDLETDLLCTTPQLHRDYKQLVVGSKRGWKPKLEMIKEIPPPIGKKRKVKMLLSASITRMKRKLKKNNNSSSSASVSSESHQQVIMNKKKKKPNKSMKKPSVSIIKSSKSSKNK